MAEEPPNLVLEQLRLIREEQVLTSRKIGALAEGMVSIRKQGDEINKRLDRIEHQIDGLRGDMHMVTLAVDEHTVRLDRIEGRMNFPDAH